jgi:ParB family transcriptional regulator, chromosome partitioning protein
VSKNSKTGGLGRGLDALIPRGTTPALTNKLPINQLEGNKKQPRTVFDDAALVELSKSIAEKGVLQPLLVRPKGKKYEIVAGERRWRAAKLAGLMEVPVVIRELDDRETLEIALIENLQREDLNPLEEARAFQGLLDLGSTQDQVAQALGKGRSTIANSLRLLLLSRDAQQALEEGIISAGHARAILALPKENHDKALEQIVSNDLNVRQAEALRFDNEAEVSRETLTSKPRVHRQLELELTRLAGTKVRIVGQDRGKLELYYHNLEDLNRILEMIGYEA